MAILKYNIGQERDIVLEKNDYDNSVFYDQYVRALSLVDTYIKDKSLKSSKIISFCGDRGDGKTSCMTTVINIIANKDDANSESAKFVARQRLLNLEKNKAYALELIDPSFFDEDHNVLEIVIGHLYNAFKSLSNNCNFDSKNRVLNSFQKVKKSLCLLRDSNLEAINGLHELDILSSSILLRKQMEDLITNFLSYIKKDIIIIPIDDIDLNMAHAYKMCEQIRKYLSIQNCIVFTGVKISQLLEAVECAISQSIYGFQNVKAIISENEIFEMAEKYINKLLPISGRVNMPKPYSMGEVVIRIEESNGNIIEYTALKEAIVELIFNRTRYLFYNPHDSISPIVPNNLRDLFNLVGLLVSMPDISNSKESDEKHKLDTNKNMFKSYFYTVWINYLSELTKDSFNDIREKLNKLINFDFGTSLNKEVVSILSEKFPQFKNKEKDYNSTIEEEYEVAESSNEASISTGQSSKGTSTSIILESITNSSNFGYNVSIGDVFYLFSLLEGETLSEGDYALVFFLKSFYSIKLYETYDTITENKSNVYPKQNEERVGLTVVDKRFDFTNKLQQLVGGSFFTYSPGDLMPKKKNTFAFDLRIIRGSKLHSLMSNLRKDFEEIQTQENCSDQKICIRKFNLKLQIIEFFILSIKCSIRQKEALPYNNETIANAMKYLRANLEPFHYRKFYPTTGYFIFDILAIFANIINPRYTYLRFSEIDDNLFERILNYNGSLLRKIINECMTYRGHINYEGDELRTQLHRLLSDATIRNAEVLTSVKENIVNERSTSHDSGKAALQSFMTRIQESGMSTHKTGKDAEPYHIKFHFLKPIQELITQLTTDIDEDLKETQSLFWEIFDSMGQYTSNIPPIEYVSKALRYSSRPSTLRKKLQDFDYFKKLTELELKKIFPDRDENYSKDEIQVMLELYYRSVQELPENDFTDNDNIVNVMEPPEIAASEDVKEEDNPVDLQVPRQ